MRFSGCVGGHSERAIERKANRLIGQIGRRIAELRQEAGWTQKDFAAVLNTSVQWVSLIERGKQNLTVHTLVRIADKLDVDVPTLLETPTQPGPAVRRRGRPRKDES